MAETLCADSSASSRRRGRRADRATSATRAISASIPESNERGPVEEGDEDAMDRQRVRHCPMALIVGHAQLRREVGEGRRRAQHQQCPQVSHIDRRRAKADAAAGQEGENEGEVVADYGRLANEVHKLLRHSPQKDGEASTSAWVMPVYPLDEGR